MDTKSSSRSLSSAIFTVRRSPPLTKRSVPQSTPGDNTWETTLAESIDENAAPPPVARLAFDALTPARRAAEAGCDPSDLSRSTSASSPQPGRRPAMQFSAELQVELPNLGLVGGTRTFPRSTSLQIDLFFSRMTKVTESDEFPSAVRVPNRVCR